MKFKSDMEVSVWFLEEKSFNCCFVLAVCLPSSIVLHEIKIKEDEFVYKFKTVHRINEMQSSLFGVVFSTKCTIGMVKGDLKSSGAKT